MKKKLSLILSVLLIAGMLFGTGCEKKETANDYLGRLITRAKETDGELTDVLADGITNVKEENDLVIDFPEDLKDTYAGFLKTALNQVQFELNDADKESDDVYLVRVTYEPVDIAATTEDTDSEFVKAIDSADFTAEVKALLKKDKKAMDNPEKQSGKSKTIRVTKSGEGFSVDDKELRELFEDALQGYMSPYAAVADVFDMRDFVQATLDGALKGDTAQLQAHTGMTAEEASAWYESSFSELAMEELSNEQNQQLLTDLKAIFAGCQYSVGAMHKQTDTEYVFDLTASPNLSIVQANQELSSGSYQSASEVIAATLDIYGKYAAAPALGTETTVTVTWNAFEMLDENTNDPDFQLMMDTIIPGE